MLCIWHVQKNVLAKTKRPFVDNVKFQQFLSDLQNVTPSFDQTIFEAELTNLELEYPLGMIRYLKEKWLPHKEMFVTAKTKLSTVLPSILSKAKQEWLT
jgi:hypothetical protein